MVTSQLIPLSSGTEDQDGRGVQGRVFSFSLCVFHRFIYSFNKNLEDNFLKIKFMSHRYRPLDGCQMPRGYLK